MLLPGSLTINSVPIANSWSSMCGVLTSALCSSFAKLSCTYFPFF